MTPEEIAAQEAATAAAKAEEEAAKVPSQGRTEKEKAAFTLKKTAERLAELGGDPAEVLGVKTHIETDAADEDNKPVTVGMLRDIQKSNAQKTALQMAEEIGDEETRNNVKQYLSDRIRPSGDADSDFRLALSAASAGKNKQVIEEIARFVAPKRTTSGGSMAAHVQEEFVPTPQEQTFMAAPYNVSKEKIIAARKAAADK